LLLLWIDCQNTTSLSTGCTTGAAAAPADDGIGPTLASATSTVGAK
jgi:hypothetical protein